MFARMHVCTYARTHVRPEYARWDRSAEVTSPPGESIKLDHHSEVNVAALQREAHD